LSPIYAATKGYGVGVFSLIINEALKDTKVGSLGVPFAVAGTMLTLGVMLFLYARRIIVVTDTLRSIIVSATLAICLIYLFSGVAWLFAPQSVNSFATFQSGPIGIGFSIFVIGLAASNFLLDFDLIDRGVQSKAPKYMEWYAAFGTLVTIIWLYLEILRLIYKIYGRR
jgi:uncharacterized YccA/Bax inhibitor family protein